MTARRDRILAVLVHAAPIVLGLPLYFALVYRDYGMLVYFFPGVFMAIAGLVAALAARVLSPPGFVRTEADGSLRFHAVLAIGALLFLALVFAVFSGGFYQVIGLGAAVLGVIVPLIEVGRAFVCGVAAARAA
jgi:hypothetical protein